MITYSHSGALGDIIYSLPVVKHFGKGDYFIKLHNIDNVGRKYGYINPTIVNDFHSGTLTEVDFSMLAPLLEAQAYINTVVSTSDRDIAIDYDLDSFRGVLWRSFHGNYLEGYFKTFNVPYTPQDVITPWLEVAPKGVASIVIARTFRYRNPMSWKMWEQITLLPDVRKNAIFIGLPEEHADFEKTFQIKLPYYKCRDFLDMAEVIAGSNHFIGNQTLAYSLAQGLGKSSSLETIPDRTLDRNECYFNRPDCYYF